MLVMLPPDRPNSPDNEPTSSLNSPIASTAGTQPEMFTPRLTFTVLATPSTKTSVAATGAPLAENRMLVIVSLGRVSSP